jgi:phycocyanobilin:ferredoxin oxidoreductase
MIEDIIERIPDVEPLPTIHGTVEKDDLTIHNTMYKSPALRKIHIEEAEIGGIKILHCVMFPDPHYNLPIFGCDIVSNGKVVTAAIVDVSPVHEVDKAFYNEIREVSNRFNFSGRRALPLWGDNIFSQYCKFTRLSEEIDKANFYCIVQNYLGIFRHYVEIATRDTFWVNTMKRLDDQIWYCESQKKNDKTRGILEKWFDKEWTDKYMNEVLFDEPNLKSISRPSFEGPY